MHEKIYAIIQARMSSSRLPRKVFRKIGNYPMLYHVVRQIKGSKLVDDIIIATTNGKEDNKIIDFCMKNNLKYFRGSKSDPLDRYYKCAKKYGCEPVIRIASDNPFVDPEVIDRVIKKFLRSSYDYVSNTYEKKGKDWHVSPCNFPQGVVVEISNIKALEKAWKEAKKSSEREHVFPYLISNPDLFHIYSVKNSTNLSYIRCTVDRIEDLKFVREIYSRLPQEKKTIHIKDIVKIVRKEPSLLAINSKIPFGEGYRKSLMRIF